MATFTVKLFEADSSIEFPHQDTLIGSACDGLLADGQRAQDLEEAAVEPTSAAGAFPSLPT